MDGYSPAVTIIAIMGGHRITITDKEHPTGQSVDVMDGEGSGDMLSSVYDPEDAVAFEGGIPAFVTGAISGDSTTEKTANRTPVIAETSTDSQYPTARAVWLLFNSIVDGNEVGY